MSACMDCGKNLTYNEIGAYKKICEPGEAGHSSASSVWRRSWM